jgi:pimeloyl-ACP methyl ester carboxylesterase
VLLTQGEHSPSFFASILDCVEAALPHVERRVLQGTGHVPQITDPDRYTEELRSFFKSVDVITRPSHDRTSAQAGVVAGS